MADTPKEGLTVASQFNSVKAREVDFVTRFGLNWDSLREIMGIMNPVRKAPGTTLISYTASIDLENGDVEEGAEIPYSIAKVEPQSYGDLKLQKWAKAVSIEAVNQYGATIAVQRTDEAFLRELQTKVLDEFYAFLKTGTLRPAGATNLQMGIALAIGSVVDKFKKMRRDTTNIVAFINTMDAYRYLGAAEISVQTANGLTYLENYMGASTVILSSEIEPGTVIATPADNIILYYVDPGDGEFGQLGLNYTVQGETNLIGFHANGNYSTAVGESFALMGMKLWAEYIDAIAVVSTSLTGKDGIGTYQPTDEVAGKQVSEVCDLTTVVDGSAVTVYGMAKKINAWPEFGTFSGESYFAIIKMPAWFAGKEVDAITSTGNKFHYPEFDKDLTFIMKLGKKADLEKAKKITFYIEGQEVLSVDFTAVQFAD